MKRFSYFLILIFVAIFALLQVTTAQTHFSIPFTTPTGNNATVVLPLAANPKIGTDALLAGDEIGVFTPGGLCVGFGVWTGTGNISITVWGDNDQTVPVDGMVSGESLQYRVWDKVNQIELTSVSVTYSSTPPFNSSGQYSSNRLFQLTSLVAAKKPGKPTFTNPINNGFGVALTGNLTWNAAPGAVTHTVQLSQVANFSSTILNSTGNFTSIAYPNLTNGTMYYARALGTNNEGDGEWETISFTTLLATPTLNSPANNSKGLNESSVNLSWNVVQNATSYLVQVSVNSDFSGTVVQQNVGTTNATFNGLNNFTQYFWRVQAKNGANISNYSNVWSFVTRVGKTTITNPINNAVGVPLNGNLQWSAVNGATSYEVQLIKTPATIIIQNPNVAGTQIAYPNLENFTNYEVKVIAKNADGSGEQATSTFRTILGIPTLLQPLNNSFKNPLTGNITWEAVNGATSYNLLVSTDAAFNNVVITQNNIVGTSYAYAGLLTNQKYYWKVQAQNNEGVGTFSNPFSFTTLLDVVTLVAPANGATQVSLTPNLQWNVLPGAANYHVQVSTNPSFNPIIFENPSVAGTSLGLINLNGKTNYYFRVKGFSANNEGGFSVANMFTTVLSKVILTSPSNNAQGLIATSVTFTWQVQGGATGYDILVSTNPDLSSPIVNTSTVNATYNFNNFNNNTTYYWAVRSKDNDGVGPFSDTWSFGTQLLAPNLLTPENNAINIPLIGTCTWSSVAGATSYELQIALDNAFTNILSETGTNGTTGNYEGLENAEIHYWRVRAYKNSGAGLWSSIRSFKTIALSPPTLIFPPNNSIDLYTTVSLVWNSVDEALGYNFRIATDPGFINIVAQANNLTVTNYSVSNLFVNRDYYWQVQTIGQQGTSNWSNAFTFKTLSEPVINGLMTVCENREATYSTVVSPLIDYQWTVTGGSIVGSSTGTTLKVNWGSAGQGTVKLTRSSQAWGNYTDNKTINVTKTQTQNVAITINPLTYYNGKACLNEVVTFTADVSSNGIFEYIWKVGNNVVSNAQSFDYHFTTKGNYTISLTLIGMDCEGGYASINLEAVDNCDVTIVNQDRIDVCKGSSPQLMTEVFGGSGQFSYSWTPASQLVSATVASPIVKSASTSRNFKLTVVDIGNNNYYYDNNLYMFVRTSAAVSLSPTVLIVNNGNAIDLTDENVVKATITGGTAPFDYNWTDINGDPIPDPSEVYPNVGQNRFYLTLIDADGCSSLTKTFYVYYYNQKLHGEIVTGLEGDGFMITYPNPVQNVLNIFADFSSMQNVNVRILNLLGQQVYSNNLGNHTIYEGALDLSGLSAGAYTLIVETETTVMVKVFIKQ